MGKHTNDLGDPMTVGVCTTATSCVKEATSDYIGVLTRTGAAGGVYQTSVWWLISTSTFYFQPPAHMSRQRAQRRHSSGSGVPHLRWGLHRCVNSCNGCWVGSYGERMFKRARGTDVAGKRLPRQTIPKSVFSDEDGTGVRCMQIILYFLGGR